MFVRSRTVSVRPKGTALGMTAHLTFLLLGLGSGAVYAALAMGHVVTFRNPASTPSFRSS